MALNKSSGVFGQLAKKIVAALETFEIYSNTRNIRGRVLVPPLLLWIPDTRLVRSKKECG